MNHPRSSFTPDGSVRPCPVPDCGGDQVYAAAHPEQSLFGGTIMVEGEWRCDCCDRRDSDTPPNEDGKAGEV